MNSYNIHEKYMSRAIHLAKKGQGMVSPNPMVGCVIVKGGRIIGEGYHKAFGAEHAEIDALNNCIEDPIDSDLYVNLDVSAYYEKLETTSTASAHKKKQEGDYIENLFTYNLTLNN